MIIKEQIVQELDTLDSDKLHQVADYVAFLKFRAHKSSDPESLNESEVEMLYRQFEEEDLALAEMGMSDYYQTLEAEDRDESSAR